MFKNKGETIPKLSHLFDLEGQNPKDRFSYQLVIETLLPVPRQIMRLLQDPWHWDPTTLLSMECVFKVLYINSVSFAYHKESTQFSTCTWTWRKSVCWMAGFYLLQSVKSRLPFFYRISSPHAKKYIYMHCLFLNIVQCCTFMQYVGLFNFLVTLLA